jgi:hypothetical protein
MAKIASAQPTQMAVQACKAHQETLVITGMSGLFLGTMKQNVTHSHSSFSNRDVTPK